MPTGSNVDSSEFEPMVLRNRSSSNSQERRNSVSEIAEFFQSKPTSSPMPARKMSGRNKKEEKERRKEANIARENIKNYLNKESHSVSDEQLENTNGEDHSTVSGIQHVDERNCPDTCGHNEDNNEEPLNVPPSQDETNTSIKASSIATQTEEDEILKAIEELATKYNAIDNTLNDPRTGVLKQLAKTQDKVSGLYSDIHGAVSGLKVQVQNIVDTAKANSEKLATMESSQQRMASLLDENKRLIGELKTMQGMIQKLSQQSATTADQVLNLTQCGMEQNLILYGVDNTIEVEDPKRETPMYTFRERCKYSALKFFAENLNVNLEVVDIWKAHHMGPQKQDRVRPLVVKLAYPAKELIMEHISALKGKTNPKTKQTYFISEQIPEAAVERKKQTSARLKSLKDENEKKPVHSRSTIQVINNKIVVDGKLNLPVIEPPQPSEVILLNPDKQKQVNALQAKMVENEPEFASGSEFISMAIKIHSLEELKLAYIAAAQRYPAADHIMLGYALKIDKELKVGFCDDGEHGAGMKIKDVIFDCKSKNTAVFVVRKFGGLHLGFNRFRVIESVARKATVLLNS